MVRVGLESGTYVLTTRSRGLPQFTYNTYTIELLIYQPSLYRHKVLKYQQRITSLPTFKLFWNGQVIRCCSCCCCWYYRCCSCVVLLAFETFSGVELYKWLPLPPCWRTKQKKIFSQRRKLLRMMYYSRKWHRHTRKKEIRVLLSGVEPETFRLLIRMLYHWATGDPWELKPLN